MKFRDYLIERETKIGKLISFTGDAPVKDVEKLLKDYDWYTFAIDNNSIKAKADAENKIIQNKLKEIGVTAIFHDDFTIPMGGRIKKEIKL